MEAQPKFFAAETKSPPKKRGIPLWLLFTIIGIFAAIPAFTYLKAKRNASDEIEIKKAEELAIYTNALLQIYNESWPDSDRFLKLKMIDPSTPPLIGVDLSNALRKEQKELDSLLSLRPPKLLAASHEAQIKESKDSINALKIGQKVLSRTTQDQTIEEEYAWDLYFILKGCRPKECAKDTYILTPEWHDEAITRLGVFYRHKTSNGEPLVKLRNNKKINVSTPFFSFANDTDAILEASVYYRENGETYLGKWKIDFNSKQLLAINLDAQKIEKLPKR